MSYNTPLYSVDGFGWGGNPAAFSPRPVSSSLTSPSHHFPTTMSVNVSMNMTMHGLGYDPVSDQWQPHSYDQNYGAAYSPGCGYHGVMGREEEDNHSVKEENINPRSFALFDSPAKYRLQSKSSSHSQFYEKQVRSWL